MAIRRQIYLDQKANELLTEQSRRTGTSVSELVRRAVDQTYGRVGGAEETWFQRAMRRAREDAEREPRMTWEEFFARPGITPNKDAVDWDYDRLFDEERIQEMEDELDRHSAPGI